MKRPSCARSRGGSRRRRLYGVVQFVVMPPWDRIWMIGTDLQSIGRPEPFSVRVFGSMTMPGTFAVVMEVGLLLLLSAEVRGRLPTLVLGFIGLLLSRIRTAWLGLRLRARAAVRHAAGAQTAAELDHARVVADCCRCR
jgi:hypothetical protein